MCPDMIRFKNTTKVSGYDLVYENNQTHLPLHLQQIMNNRTTLNHQNH